MSNHSSIGPSKAHRWFNCPGSVDAEAGQERTTSEAAEEGNAAHWLAEQVLLSYRTPGSSLFDPKSVNEAPNGVEITDEMIESVDLYLTDILKTVQQYGGMQSIMIEDRIHIDRIHDQCFGTADCWAFDENRGIVYLWDFKYGHRVVEAYENLQLTCYAAGIIDQLGLPDDKLRVEVKIVQPRAYHVLGPVRSWQFVGSSIRGLINQLHSAAHEAWNGSAKRKTGDHCHRCLAISKCEAATRAAQNAIDVSYETAQEIQYDTDTLSTLISQLRRGKKRLDDLLEVLEIEAQERIANGEVIQGFANGHGRGSEIWTIDKDVLIEIGNCMGVDLRKEGVKTPNQARKLIDESVINPYTKKVEGKRKLIEDKETLAYHIFKSK